MKTLETSRMEARVTPKQKELVARAAAVTGASLSDFMKSALIEKAQATLREHTVIELCVDDQQQLAEHLLPPPETPANFKQLMEWRKRSPATCCAPSTKTFRNRPAISTPPPTSR